MATTTTTSAAASSSSSSSNNSASAAKLGPSESRWKTTTYNPPPAFRGCTSPSEAHFRRRRLRLNGGAEGEDDNNNNHHAALFGSATMEGSMPLKDEDSNTSPARMMRWRRRQQHQSSPKTTTAEGGGETSTTAATRRSNSTNNNRQRRSPRKATATGRRRAPRPTSSVSEDDSLSWPHVTETAATRAGLPVAPPLDSSISSISMRTSDFSSTNNNSGNNNTTGTAGPRDTRWNTGSPSTVGVKQQQEQPENANAAHSPESSLLMLTPPARHRASITMGNTSKTTRSSSQTPRISNPRSGPNVESESLKNSTPLEEAEYEEPSGRGGRRVNSRDDPSSDHEESEEEEDEEERSRVVTRNASLSSISLSFLADESGLDDSSRFGGSSSAALSVHRRSFRGTPYLDRPTTPLDDSFADLGEDACERRWRAQGPCLSTKGSATMQQLLATRTPSITNRSNG